MRQVVTPEALALHHLDQDCHALVVILQAAAAPVKQRIGVQRGGIHPGDGPRQGVQVLRMAALVGQEDAFVFTGKRGAKIILQQAGRAHNHRLVAQPLQHPAQLIQQFGGKFALLKILQYMRDTRPASLLRFCTSDHSSGRGC